MRCASVLIALMLAGCEQLTPEEKALRNSCDDYKQHSAAAEIYAGSTYTTVFVGGQVQIQFNPAFSSLMAAELQAAEDALRVCRLAAEASAKNK